MRSPWVELAAVASAMVVESIVTIERLTWPTLSLVFSFCVWITLIVSLTSPGWIVVNLFVGKNTSGNITIGLIRTTERIDTGYGPLDEKYRDYLDLTPLMIVVGCCSVAIVVCTAAMAFEFTNTYRVVESWLLGPSTVYLITLITAILLAVACGSFTEFYLNMDMKALLNISRHDSLTFNHYTTEIKVYYSSILLFIGAILSIFPVLFSWRLTVLLPDFYKSDISGRLNINSSNNHFVLAEMPSSDSGEDHNDEEDPVDKEGEDEYSEDSDDRATEGDESPDDNKFLAEYQQLKKNNVIQ